MAPVDIKYPTLSKILHKADWFVNDMPNIKLGCHSNIGKQVEAWCSFNNISCSYYKKLAYDTVVAYDRLFIIGGVLQYEEYLSGKTLERLRSNIPRVMLYSMPEFNDVEIYDWSKI